MSIHEQARAEAEKRYDSQAYDLRASFVGGFLAGHEAATRTRVVTTVAELDALAVGSVIRNSYGAVAVRTSRLALGWRYAGSASWYDLEDRQLPACVLYEPKEDR